MKIGIDARMYRSSVAGIGRYSQNLIKNLLEIDRENQYVLFMTPEDKNEFENSIKIAFRHENLKLKIVLSDVPHFSLAEQFTLPKIIARENLDLMHFLNFNYPVRYKGKFVVTIHDLTLFYFPGTARDTNIYKRLGFKFVMKKACQDSQKIIAVSSSTKKDIISKFKTPVGKIQVIYEASDDRIFGKVSPEIIKKLNEKYQINKPLILCVGQFRTHKNITGLLKAFEILRKDFPCKLVILGKKELNAELKNLLDNSPYMEDIIMPGFVLDSELSAWYELASVFVFPSFYEGFGLPGLEAMMAGTPVVASERSSLPEIYQDAAIYFDPYDIQDIADKIKTVMTDKNLQARLVSNGQKVVQRYSWKKTAEETLDLYKSL